MLNPRSWGTKLTLGLALATTPALVSVSWSGSRQSELIDIFQKKLWVTISTANRLDGIRITATVGNHKQLVYSERAGDIGAGYAALSPSGERVAFVKTVRIGGGDDVLLKLCTVDLDGSNYTEVLDFVRQHRDIAWSPDQGRLAFLGSLRKGTPDLLIVLDITTRPPTVILQQALPKAPDHPLPGQMSFINLTSQAWAPDSRRLVYVNADGHMMILDLAARTEEDLGVGNEPTWSRDGAFIAYRDDAFRRAPGDYLVLPVDAPRQSRRILKNAAPDGGFRGSQGFFGLPLWSPDDRFLLIMRVVGPEEFQRPYVVELSTGRFVELPPGSMGDMQSWGGKP